MQNPINVEITKRFYEAIKMLMESRVIRGRQTYCTLANIDKRNFYKQEKDLDANLLQLYWLVPLVKEFNINALWLLTGKGNMFNKDITPLKK
ncbi:hypothetical protein M2451_002577 [Dysgonomonas sp. PFB1-18]|uniref:hypothetical protein n=1 Tax=unclassified Dysgonomonas TaxID=2630389 RepID=UPI00247595FD|nr:MULTISPECIES: hypothetical protein [unclassified Dysgonomonas]MDH6308058.1 hypothetical protein [Dysgonomonas sp. PF1-14]MDH6339597.1 hypothetical protein [Dysgonomonas sp. PF1-16]MDH6381248.1 hypothetical protein [Dysgonomonas sp. PFB1-18]MDH6398460.1 hypothetical protein [Dysgonomonas sp. PF1-23]